MPVALEVQVQAQAVVVAPEKATAAERRGEALVCEARALSVVDRDSHESAQRFLVTLAGAEREVSDLFAEPKKRAHEAHKAVVAAERRLLDPLQDARRIVSGHLSRYESEELVRQANARREAEAAARRAEEDRQLAEALAAEEAGEDGTAILEAPTPVAIVHVEDRRAEVAGVSGRSTWAAEVTDLRALARHVAATGAVHLIAANTTALNGLARSLRGALNVPGVRAIESRSHAVRR